MHFPKSLSITLVSLALLQVGPLPAAEFAGLGDLPGGTFHSRAFAVADDGSVVVEGISVAGTFDLNSFRWTDDAGMLDVGFGRGAGWLPAQAVSADGSVVVGGDDSGSVLWTEAGGRQTLGTLGGRSGGSSMGVSADGSVVAGWAWNLLDHEAFLWTEESGMDGLGTLAPGMLSHVCETCRKCSPPKTVWQSRWKDGASSPGKP